MNLRQIHTLCEIVDCGLRVSGAAEATNRSQPSVSRQIKDLEEELGFVLFFRKRNKILGLTPNGEAILKMARRIVQEAENMRRFGRDSSATEEGDLALATTHTQARYVLPQVVQRFVRRYPGVRLTLLQGTPAQCRQMVIAGTADMAICAEVNSPSDEILDIPCFQLTRAVITPVRHPLLSYPKLTLKLLSNYPIITYGEGYSARLIIDRTFADAGLKPNFVMRAIDADVSKTYVEMGMGIAILANVAFSPRKDSGLRRIRADHLFSSSLLSVVVRRNVFLPRYMLSFITMFAPYLDRKSLETAISEGVMKEAVSQKVPSL